MCTVLSKQIQVYIYYYYLMNGSDYRSIPHGNRLQLQLYTDGCESSPEHSVTYVEHVQVSYYSRLERHISLS